MDTTCTGNIGGTSGKRFAKHDVVRPWRADARGDAAPRSEANASQVAPLLFEILKRVLEEYAVSLEEAVQRLASVKSKDAAEFGLGYPAITKLFKRKGLKRASRQVGGALGKTLRQIVRNLKSHSQLTE